MNRCLGTGWGQWVWQQWHRQRCRQQRHRIQGGGLSITHAQPLQPLSSAPGPAGLALGGAAQALEALLRPSLQPGFSGLSVSKSCECMCKARLALEGAVQPEEAILDTKQQRGLQRELALHYGDPHAGLQSRRLGLCNHQCKPI